MPEAYRKAIPVLQRWFGHLAKNHPDKLPIDLAQAGAALCQTFRTCERLAAAVDLAIGNNWRSLKPEHAGETKKLTPMKPMR